MEILALEWELLVLRFARNEIHQPHAERNLRVRVRAARGRRIGTAYATSSADLEKIAREAAELARFAPEIPHFSSFAPPASHPQIPPPSEESLSVTPERMSERVEAVISKAEERGLFASGALEFWKLRRLVANTEGLRAEDTRTIFEFRTVMSSEEGGSGYAQAISSDFEELDVEGAAEKALEKASASKSPSDLPPGEYEVILEEQAVSELLDFVGLGFGAKEYQEGRSFLCGRIGERVPGGYVFVDGALVGDVGPMVMRDREILARDGFVIAVIRLSKKTGEPIGRPEIITRGFVFVPDAQELIGDAQDRILKVLAKGAGGRVAIGNRVRDELAKFLYSETKRRPMIIPVVIEENAAD